MYDPRTVRRVYDKANELRQSTLDICWQAKRGHLTSSFSAAELFAALHYGGTKSKDNPAGGILRLDPKNSSWEERDRFVLSKGQASPMYYAVLADLGFFPKTKLGTFCQKDGMFGVHLQNNVPGVEVTTGSLGHGFGVAAGIALAAKMDKKPYQVVAMLGDGECQEGSIWETFMFAPSKGLSNLTAIIDRNGQCATQFIEDSVGLHPLKQKLEAFGWKVREINGHSAEEVLDAFDGFRTPRDNRPYAIIADTIKGKGSEHIESKVDWHSRAPATQAEYELIKMQIQEGGKAHGQR